MEAQLGAKKNWYDSDDLAMMFQGAYPTEFYRALARRSARGGARRAASELDARCGGRWKRCERTSVTGQPALPLMDLLLTHGYFLYEDPKELQIMKPYAPLGILYLSSHLRAKGFDVEIYDSTFGSREELLRILETGRRRCWESTAI